MKRLKGIAVRAGGPGNLNSQPKEVSAPKRVVLPVDFPLGRVQAEVVPGDSVKRGQRIAGDPNGILPAVRASIAGTVADIKVWLGPFGREYLSVVIEGDGRNDEVEKLSDQDGPSGDPYDWLRLISEAGIREADQFPWPLSVRIAQPALIPPMLFPFVPDLRRSIDCLIINGLDRQPGVWLRSSALEFMGESILEGIPILKTLSGARRTVLAVSKKEKLTEAMEHGLRMEGVELIRCPDVYPAGLEPLLVQRVTGYEMPQPNGDARAVGAVMVDVISTARVADAVMRGLPATEALVQVSAPSQWIHGFISVREGTLLNDALQTISPAPKNAARVVTRGPFLGHAMYDLEVPLTQQTEAVIFQGEQDFKHFEDEPCINCGRCVQSCPMRLFPNELTRACEYGRFEEAEAKDLFRCIECGICSYVCPVRRPMVHLLRFGKNELSAEKEER
ncbi:MAG: 4Fe-4S dicluster domain-containing protein [Desulfobacteraceae bacterium]